MVFRCSSLQRTFPFCASLSSRAELSRLDGTRLGSTGITVLAEWLATNKSLCALSLPRNTVGVEGVTALSQALRTNTTLRELDLSHNLLMPKCMHVLAEALHVNTTLTGLRLCNISFDNEVFSALARIVSVTHTLTDLDLSSNRIGRGPLEEILTALSSNRSIKVFTFGRITVHESEEKIESLLDQLLCNVLRENTTLLELQLCSNHYLRSNDLSHLSST
eukprot:m.127578 g.127578  ORF g.127578 m.127578 type:complete len:220 (+) comp14709_c1_seq10:239-898(+)